MALDHQKPKCLFFDVFGTCVDWRKTVTDTLWNMTREALNSPSASMASRIRMNATDMVGVDLIFAPVQPLTLFARRMSNGEKWHK